MSNPNFPQNHNQFEQEPPQTILWPEIPSTIEAANEYQEKMEDVLKSNGWDEDEVHQVGYAFQEILKNAIIHGSLGLKKSPGEEKDDWSAEVAKASVLPEHRGKTVSVAINITSRQITINIQDMGKDTPEFWKQETAGTNTGADTQWKSGRGEMISRAYLNKVAYQKNDIGVKTTLLRDLDIPIARE